MNLHEIPAFTQNFSIKLTCCVPEAVMMLYCTITKSEVKKLSEKKYFQKIVFLLCVVLLPDVTA